jgi:Protein of unknown function (DUF3426)
MFAQCPDCRKTYSIPKKNTRSKKAQIFCSACKKKFSVSALLNENSTVLISEAKAEYIQKPASKRKTRAPITEINPPSINTASYLKQVSLDIGTKPTETTVAQERLPWEEGKKDLNMNWLLGCIISFMLLIGQIIYFESSKLSQNVSYRPTLEKFCRWLGCKLADYENLAELAVLQGSFKPNSDNTIVFKAAINNQAAFKQRLPNIKLTLLDFNEQLFAQRVFTPTDYLVDTKRTNFSILADETVEAKLTIVTPKTAIGGYNFDLIY